MSWQGATLFKSVDGGSTYEPELQSIDEAAIGVANTLLGNFTGGNVFDYANTVSVTLTTEAALVSYTQLQVLNGAGAFLLGAAGRWEVIQYQTATLTAARTYTLSGLLRGRRGSEHAQGLHAIADKFVLFNVRTCPRSNPGTAAIGLARNYKGVTYRGSLSTASAQSFTNSAVGLECYAPVHLSGVRDGSNNLTINWIRRTRTGGEWRDYVDVGIGEASLLFDVEVWNSTYTTLLRTFNSLTSTSAAYSAAEQTADGTTPGNPVYLQVYQLSPTVGRGYKLQGSI